MESLRSVVTRLFADIQDVNTADLLPSGLADGEAYYGFFRRKSAKRRRVHLLHPNVDVEEERYDNSILPFPLHTTRFDFDNFVHEYVRACQIGGMIEPLKTVMLKYVETPLTLTKSIRLMTFLHHLLQVIPVTPAQPSTATVSFAPFPLGQLFEELTVSISFRTTPAPTPTMLSTWIITMQFMLSCLRSNSRQALFNAGLTNPVILGMSKHILLELTRLPWKQMDDLQETCFSLGQEMLNFFFLKDQKSGQGIDNAANLVHVSYYDVIYSFPEFYGHFLNTAPPVVVPQPSIANHKIWMMTLNYMITSIHQEPKLLDNIPTLVAINIIKHMLREINTLPSNLSTGEVNCVNKGKELINLLLLGPSDDGAGAVSHYDIIVALPDVYGHFLRGTFAQSVHWTMEKFINELGKRRRHLAFLMMPPDASWPLIYQMSRRHEYNDLTTRTSFHMFEGDLIDFVKEGNSTNIETHFRDLLFQRASMDEFRQLAMSLSQSGLDNTQIRKAMVAKARDVIRCIQQHSRPGKRDVSEREKESFNAAHGGIRGEDIKMSIPSNMDLWELMNETADQLYSFVAAEFFSYEDILQDFYDLVYASDGEAYPPGTKDRLRKDNGLVWLLLQLFYIEKVSSTVIQKDFENEETLFDKLVCLYNEDQILSMDAFSLRDLSLQCAINHQKDSIKDVINIKQRHPKLAASLRYAGLCYQIQVYFNHHYHKNVPTNFTLFHNLDAQEMTKVAIESQLIQDVVPYTLYVYLVPTKADIGTLGHPSTTYIKGGTLCYKLLDLLSVNAKHRLLQVIYKMMLDSELGPRYQANTSPPIACVPPQVLDVVYKLLYSAPCSAELMIKEIFDKLLRCDKLIKMRTDAERNNGEVVPFPDQTMRWLHTMLQLMTYRFVRFLKYSPLSPGLLHYIRYSISHLDHRQGYRVVESFASNIIRMQIDVKVLRSLDDPNRDKPIWFAESEMLARAMVATISRLIKTRGQADIKTEQVYRVLSSLYTYKLEWSPESIQYFPKAIRQFYTDPDSPNQSIASRPAVDPARIQQLLTNNKSYSAYLLQGSPEAEREVLQHFGTLEHQPDLLCMLWMMAVMRQSVDGFHMPSVRKLLLLIAPSRMATNVIDLIDFVLLMDPRTNNRDMCGMFLNTIIWKYQWVDFNHVIAALMKGSGSPERTTRAFSYVRYLLCESHEFQNRVNKWDSLEFSPRHWTEEDFHEKLMRYLNEFPEYHEFEAFARSDHASTTFDPPLQSPMPIYLTNVISEFMASLELLITRLIEHSQTDLLGEILDRYGHLFYSHPYPLSFVCNLLLYYYPSTTLRDTRICKKILRLLDFNQYDIAPEAMMYSRDEQMDGSAFDTAYYERAIYKLVENLNPQKCAPRKRPDLPERHFREIGSPAIEAISIATLEIMLTPVMPEKIVKHILDMALLRGSHHVGVSALTIHAIGLLMSSLPSDAFMRLIWEELNQVILTNRYLLEVSEPCRLIRCGVPKRTNGRYVMTPSLPDFSTTAILKDSMSVRLRKAMMFPYIFNDYKFNLHNYSTNAPNSFLCLFHSILHYSSLDAFSIFLEYLRSLRLSGRLRTDVQLLYICFLIGPALHRLDKLDSTDAELVVELMYMVKQVTSHMDMKDGWSTQALEQVFDFLYHIRVRFVKSTELAVQLKDIIRSMKSPTSQRLLRLVV
ncbi:mediator complex subunit 23-domain-containing protein [Radiomyces spectabilis]|uniref:mediator complex subunit 23-domain-containing protein n=1 Tax=Radiomyces spectabilis TaxID=64574 RepID=UPI002220CB15|nr:mediator complex subunit 23-domain-containing protein [Radiomyces spectabilis]KAI8372734.1 mediator complex subunit 23-domain-containing protein [Radiomyces spectabilis]